MVPKVHLSNMEKIRRKFFYVQVSFRQKLKIGVMKKKKYLDCCILKLMEKLSKKNIPRSKAIMVFTIKTFIKLFGKMHDSENVLNMVTILSASLNMRLKAMTKKLRLHAMI